MTLEETEDLVQQLLADIDAGSVQQLEEATRPPETTAEVLLEEDFVPSSR
jgi:hypothetical protein